MKYIYLAGAISSIANSIMQWDGKLNSAVLGWAVAAMLFIYNFNSELE